MHTPSHVPSPPPIGVSSSAEPLIIASISELLIADGSSNQTVLHHRSRHLNMTLVIVWCIVGVSAIVISFLVALWREELLAWARQKGWWCDGPPEDDEYRKAEASSKPAKSESSSSSHKTKSEPVKESSRTTKTARESSSLLR